MPDLTGKTAVVTGASRGIGLAIAQRIVASGGRVCLTGRDPDALADAVAGLGGSGHALGVAGHTDDARHRAETVRRAVAAFGSLDLLVNNAATNPLYGPVLEAAPDAFRKLLEVNVIAPQAWIREACEQGLAGRGGAVLNIASISGLHVEPGLGPYGASKAALIHLTKQFAVELAPRVRVNAIAPAVVKTRFASALYADREEAVAASYPAGRLGVPDDVAGAAAYLLSDDAAWVTGQTLVLDGGLALGLPDAAPPAAVGPG